MLSRNARLPALLLIALCSSLSPFLAGSYCAEIFSDDFEAGELADRWDQVTIRDSAAGGIETDPEFVHSGQRSLRLTAVANGGQAAVAQVVRWFLPGHDQLYFRWYAMFAEDFDQGNFMHWTMIGGSRIDDKYSGMGQAGIRPNGADFFTAMFEPARDRGKYPPPGALQFSVSYPEMKISADGKYWTNSIGPEQPLVLERGRWYCLEAMVKLNRIGRTDGELACWVDGEKLLHVRDFHWRDSDALRLNYFWFSVYIHQAVRNNTCWYDDLVISTAYVGPRQVQPPGGGR